MMTSPTPCPIPHSLPLLALLDVGCIRNAVPNSLYITFIIRFSYINGILQDTDDSVKMVELLPNGTWRPVEDERPSVARETHAARSLTTTTKCKYSATPLPEVEQTLVDGLCKLFGYRIRNKLDCGHAWSWNF